MTIYSEMLLSNVCVACYKMKTLGNTGPCLSGCVQQQVNPGATTPSLLFAVV